jgi:hypothetical protein
MRRNVLCGAVVAGLLFVSGCTINSTVRSPAGALTNEARAVVVYGVKVEGVWKYEGFAIQLAEYDMARADISGNCFRFNRTEAVVPPGPGEVTYFAFEVAPGHYVYSPFNGALLAGDVQAFDVPAGKTVYIGDFIFTENHDVVLARHLEDKNSAIHAALPAVSTSLALANASPVAAPHGFLCTP